MKRMTIWMLALMLIAALSLAALAEGLTPGDMLAEAVDAEVPEQEYLLGGEAGPVEESEATRQAEPAVMAPSDFEIEGTVLKKYNGSDANVTVPNGITEIGADAFSEVSRPVGCVIETVVLPDTVTKIGDRAFFWCALLRSINLPDGITSIGESAFAMCKKLDDVKLPPKITTIEKKLFSDCESLPAIEIPKGVTSIADNAFMNCKSLTSVDIPEGVTRVDFGAFQCCDKLAKVHLPESLTYIGSSAFYKCFNLVEINLPKKLEILNGLFDGCEKLPSITLPESLTTIMMDSFRRCASLTAITIPASVTLIGHEAFSTCINLKDVTIESPKYPSSQMVPVYDKEGNVKSFELEGTLHFEDDAFQYCSENLVFHTQCETLATKWAEERGFTVVKAGHVYETVPGKAATGTATGLTDGVACVYCANVQTPQNVIPILTATESPTAAPTVAPTAAPTMKPGDNPTEAPTAAPTVKPGDDPTEEPTEAPTAKPGDDPTEAPGDDPTEASDDQDPRYYDVAVSGNTTITCLDVDSVSVVLDEAVFGSGDFPETVETSNEDVVDYTGNRFSAYKAGKATLTVKTYNGHKLTLDFNVVKDGGNLELKLNKSKAALPLGSTSTLGPIQMPLGVTNETITWTSSNPKVAKVGADGRVTALKKGKATVTAKAANGQSAACKITVKALPKVTGLSLKAGKKRLTVTWKQAKGVAGYQIQYSLKKSFSGAKTVKVNKATTVKKAVKKLKSGKTYYVRVRAYNQIGKKYYYSAWSKAKTAKVK